MEEGHALDPIPPGEILRCEFMEPLGISQNQLARDLDVPVARVSELVHGRTGLYAYPWISGSKTARSLGTS